METPLVVGAFAGLLITISLLQPLARRMGLAPSVLLAMVGTLIGIIAVYLLNTTRTDAFNDIALVFVDPPFDSEKILYVFLPILLFQTSLTLDVRRIFEDIGPILVMAVVAVFIATGFIGLALYPLAGFSLIACLLLGSIVATTDPVAVVAIFRDIGAPARLGRIVEGESLLNDAAAIVLFVILLGILTGTQEPDLVQATIAFFRSFIGGVIVGAVMARLCVMLLPLMRELPLAQVTLSLALPYLIYVVSDQSADVSAVVAVVAAGIVFNLYGPSRITPQDWDFLHHVWEQIAFWAASLIFVLAAILIPRLVEGLEAHDFVLLLVLIAAALVSRALVIFGLLPVITFFQMGQAISTKFKIVMLWGGMRGAVTLTLALSVAENPMLGPEVSAFVTKLATGFVLFTLLVYGTSLKPLIKLLGLNRLSKRDEAMRRQFLALTFAEVEQEVADAAKEYQIESRIADRVTSAYHDRAEGIATAGASMDELADKERVILGLIALADRERHIVLEHFNQRTVSSRAISLHLAMAGRIGDLTRTEGRAGYNKASRHPLQFGVPFRVAQWLQSHLKIQGPLRILLADRFEFLLVCRIISNELMEFNRRRIKPLVGDRVAKILDDTLCARRDDITRALDALRLQYPDYSDALETQFLRKTAFRLEEMAYAEAHSQALIGPELYNDLQGDLSRLRLSTEERPGLDLGLGTKDLLAKHPLFTDLPDERLAEIAKVMQPEFAIPGQMLIRTGERGDRAFFIASGAAEVQRLGQTFRLGRGDLFGEMALLTGKPRSADVIALGYCQLLVLKAADFRSLMSRNPDLKAHVDRLVQTRQAMNSDLTD